MKYSQDEAGFDAVQAAHLTASFLFCIRQLSQIQLPGNTPPKPARELELGISEMGYTSLTITYCFYWMHKTYVTNKSKFNRKYFEQIYDYKDPIITKYLLVH